MVQASRLLRRMESAALGVLDPQQMQVVEHAFDWLDAPPVRVHGLDVPLPYAANLEKLALPQPEWVVDAVKKIV